MRLLPLASFILGAGIFAPLSAAADPGMSVVAGTTGAGIQFHTSLTPQVTARLGANAFNRDHTGSRRFTYYDVRLHFRTIEALADWHPMSNGFRFTGGLILNTSKVGAIERPSIEGSFTFNNNTYRVSDIGEVVGNAEFRRVAPYVGIGWGNAPANGKGGWSVTSDVGLMYLGKANVTLTSTGCDFGRSLLGQIICNRLRSDLVNESARLEDDLRRYRIYPVVRLGVNYRF